MWMDTQKQPQSEPNMKLLSIYSFLLLLLLVFTQCQDDKTALIAQKVQERVQEFRMKKKQECQQTLLLKAERMVDSLLLTEARQGLQDSLSRMRPFRPIQPPDVPAIDSSKIAPLFKDTDQNNR